MLTDNLKCSSQRAKSVNHDFGRIVNSKTSMKIVAVEIVLIVCL